ncbi:CRISPR-associated Cse1 family protein [Nitrospirillum viridazoti Y2]|uniref:CRISPR-associated Cse1 family protein n=1 Tax=Nitrospirillum amazonense TaxID=28077 RepID=A0A560J0B2_9PROT|nr:CRISPR-associated Cse1 family protein [Nitrospirillum amazonense Y2]TWB64421.1 CRISPR-associated Cse1 family protein [Nitrospirillum amazonense]
MYNLLTQPLLTTSPAGTAVSLPGLLTQLSRDEVEGFPALRPHQSPLWHSFLVQVSALALLRADLAELPQDEEAWRTLLRGLTPDFRDDEPWQLVVTDTTKPAFLQPAIPPGVTLSTPAPTPDALDLLITAKNHDLKQAVAQQAAPEDFVYALVSLQTGDGYNGAGNYGISRMNGGSSSRPLLGLAPAVTDNDAVISPRPGAWFRRDVLALLAARKSILRDFPDFAEESGLALLWLAPWPEEGQLRINQLDPWYVEVCRRVRLLEAGEKITAVKGTSKAARVAAKELNGAVGDPWAPVHKDEHKSFTLSGQDFDYATLSKLLFSGNWKLPVLAKPAPFERNGASFLLIAAALARGNSKTEGFKYRELPMSSRIAQAMTSPDGQESLNDLAQQQVEEIELFDHALRGALALAAAGGEWEKVGKAHYARTNPARLRLDRVADSLFFQHLWHRFDAQEAGEDAVEAERMAFASALWAATRDVFSVALPAIPSPARFRHRTDARAHRRLWGDSKLRQHFPALFMKEPQEVSSNVAQ